MARKLALTIGGLVLTTAGYVGYAYVRGVGLPGMAAEPIASAIVQPLATGDSTVLATFAKTRCRWATEQARQNCYQEILLAVVEKNQIRLAMDALSVLGRLDPSTVAKGHDLTHVVGINAWTAGEDVGEVYDSCTGLYQSGCYHGVVQAYLDAKGTDSTTVAQACNLIKPATTSQWLRFQCVHGIGHGLVNAMSMRLPQALAGCDWLVDGWDATSCYGGAFMEFIVAGRGQSHHPHKVAAANTPTTPPAAEHPHHEMADSFPARQPSDPLYPCSVLGIKYQSSCYGMQAGIIIETTGADWGKIAKACDGAPVAMRPACYQGVGTYLSGFVVRDPDKAIKRCDQGSDTYKPWCFVGVVKNFIDVTAKADDGLDFCRRVVSQPTVATTCYVAIGEEMAVLYSSPDDRARECARAESEFVAACRYGAALTTDRPAKLVIAPTS